MNWEFWLMIILIVIILIIVCINLYYTQCIRNNYQCTQKNLKTVLNEFKNLNNNVIKDLNTCNNDFMFGDTPTCSDLGKSSVDTKSIRC